MGSYDIYLTKRHPAWMKRIFNRYNSHILQFLLSILPRHKPLRILEVGPGKGYFYDSVRGASRHINYSAVDRNVAMLKHLKIKTTYQTSLPKLPPFRTKFDIIYAAYVIEHLHNGDELWEFIGNCRKNIAKGGIIVFLAPNAQSQKMEFWNADYTHMYATTKRNVAMAFSDHGIRNLNIYPVTDAGLYLTNTSALWGPIKTLSRIALFWYNYRWANILAGFFVKTRDYDMENWFYRLYCFLQAESLLFIARP